MIDHFLLMAVFLIAVPILGAVFFALVPPPGRDKGRGKDV